MRALGLRRVVNGQSQDDDPEELADRRQDRVNRTFTVSLPNALWVADLTVRRDLARAGLRRVGDQRVCRRIFGCRARCVATSRWRGSSKRSTTANVADGRS
jgi:hypothetical protein